MWQASGVWGFDQFEKERKNEIVQNRSLFITKTRNLIMPAWALVDGFQHVKCLVGWRGRYRIFSRVEYLTRENTET